MGRGLKYKIALLDSENFALLDVLELKFKPCECGEYQIPCPILNGQNYTDDGESKWTNDQMLLDVCSNCGDHSETDRFTHSSIFSPSEVEADLPDEFTRPRVPK